MRSHMPSVSVMSFTAKEKAVTAQNTDSSRDRSHMEAPFVFSIISVYTYAQQEALTGVREFCGTLLRIEPLLGSGRPVSESQ